MIVHEKHVIIAKTCNVIYFLITSLIKKCIPCSMFTSAESYLMFFLCSSILPCNNALKENLFFVIPYSHVLIYDIAISHFKNFFSSPTPVPVSFGVQSNRFSLYAFSLIAFKFGALNFELNVHLYS